LRVWASAGMAIAISVVESIVVLSAPNRFMTFSLDLI
jgi:hypothetical protein